MPIVGADQTKARPLRTGITDQLGRLRSPSCLIWWEWGKIVGAVGLGVLVILWVLKCIPSPVVVAVLLHITGDFTFQSPSMALRKWDRGRHLFVHALVAGGLPLAVAGFLAGGSVAAATWAVLGMASHYAIDWTRRFGIQQLVLGVVLDQVCHVLSILVLVLMGWPR